MRIGKTIYLDHQATTPVDQRVLDKMMPFFSYLFGNPHSVDHFMGWEASKAIDAAKIAVASLIGADPDEVIFTSGATESNNMALFGLALGEASKKKRRILISTIEHKSVIAVARELEKNHGFSLEYVPVMNDGMIDIDYLEDIIDYDVLFLSVMAVNNEIGTIQPARIIKAICEKFDVIYHSDAAQATCGKDITSIADDVDILSLSAHKMYGPKGIGALFVRREMQPLLKPITFGGNQQGGLRPGTLPVPLCIGMAAAAELLSMQEAELERESIRKKTLNFVERMVTQSRYHIELNGPSSASRHPGNASLLFHGFSAHDILLALQPHVSASTGSACTSGIPEPSHVLKAIGLSEEEANSSIRFSVGRFTSETDIDEAIGLITATLNRLS